MENITKVSSTSFRKVVSQPDLVIEKSLDDLLSEKASLEQGIQNNQNAIVDFTTKLETINSEIESVQKLGVKTSAEAVEEASAAVESLKVEVEDNN